MPLKIPYAANIADVRFDIYMRRKWIGVARIAQTLAQDQSGAFMLRNLLSNCNYVDLICMHEHNYDMLQFKINCILHYLDARIITYKRTYLARIWDEISGGVIMLLDAIKAIKSIIIGAFYECVELLLLLPMEIRDYIRKFDSCEYVVYEISRPCLWTIINFTLHTGMRVFSF